MQVNELRVGNIVFNHKGVPELVTGAMIEEIDYSDYEILIKPIPLTEEWLLKFGFEKGKIKNSYSSINWNSNNKNFFLFQSQQDKLFHYAFENDMWDIDDIKLQYVHQLQNLYFALTGKELTC